jgi:hypothetical protein
MNETLFSPVKISGGKIFLDFYKPSKQGKDETARQAGMAETWEIFPVYFSRYEK